VAVMQANNLAADSREYEAVAYALDLAELGSLAESNASDLAEIPKAH